MAKVGQAVTMSAATPCCKTGKTLKQKKNRVLQVCWIKAEKKNHGSLSSLKGALVEYYVTKWDPWVVSLYGMPNPLES